MRAIQKELNFIFTEETKKPKPQRITKRNRIQAKPRKVYFKTTDIPAGQVRDATKRAEKQAALIERFFKNNPHGVFTPYEIHDLIPQLSKAPITSVRRAMTVLSTETEKYPNPVLIKTDMLKKGIYGEMNHCWALRSTYLINQAILNIQNDGR